MRVERSGSTRPSSTARRTAVPCVYCSPKSSTMVSVWESNMRSARGPYRCAAARSSGSSTPWSPPKAMGTTPASCSGASVSTILS